MKHFILFFSALLAVSCGSLTSQDITLPADPVVAPSVILPMVPVLVQPETPPDPLPKPESVSTLKPDEFYVVESTRELIALSSPPGIISIESTTGPIKVRGIFADGTGKIETRGYRSAYVYFITAESPGKVELILIPVGVSTQSDIVRQVLTVSGVGPRPGPDVVPDPVVPDPVIPVVTTGKLKVLIIDDPSMRASIPASQISAMEGQAVRDYLKTHCTITDSTPDFRAISPRQDVSNQAAWIKTAFAEPRPALPFIAITNGTAGFAGPLPLTMEETLTLLKKYGGP